MSFESEKKLKSTQASYFLDEDSITLYDILLTLARNLKVIVLLPTITCFLTIIYVLFFAKPIYTSTAKIMSSVSGGKISQAAGLAAQFGINISTGQTETKWVYPEIIRSRTLARLMLKRKFDTKEYGMQKSLLQILTYGNVIPKVGIDTLEIKAINKFIDMIDVSEDIKTGIYTLSIRASEPSFSSEVNRALLEELEAHQQKYNKAKTSKTRQFIEERILTTEKDLQEAENNLRKFMDTNRRIENSPALLLEQQRLQREVTVLIGVFTTLKQQLETTKIEEVKELDYVVIVDPPEVPLSKSNTKKRHLVIYAGLFGIGIGMVFAFIREYFINSNKVEKNKINEIRSLVIKNVSELISRKKA